MVNKTNGVQLAGRVVLVAPESSKHVLVVKSEPVSVLIGVPRVNLGADKGLWDVDGLKSDIGDTKLTRDDAHICHLIVLSNIKSSAV